VLDEGDGLGMTGGDTERLLHDEEPRDAAHQNDHGDRRVGGGVDVLILQDA
jgi:hypothetical protein